MNKSELEDKIEKLNIENEILRENIQNLHNLLGYEICLYFNKTNSIKKTREKFYFISIKHCYDTLVDFNDDNYLVKKAIDFLECYQEIFGEEYKK